MKDRTAELKDFLSAMKKHNRGALTQLSIINDWRSVAARELERRAHLVLNTINDDMVLAIAHGEVDVGRAIREVLAD